MTDKEIIKALECCAGKDVLCNDCAYFSNLPYAACRSLAAQQALDLIKHQRAEIAILNVQYAGACEHIKRLKGYIKKIEDIFKERAQLGEFQTVTVGQMWDDLDDLVKEMVGEKQ